MSDVTPIAGAAGEIAKTAGEVVHAVTANRDLANEAARSAAGQDVLGRIRNENLAMRSLIENTLMKGIVRAFFRGNEYVTSGQIYQDLAPKLSGLPPEQLGPPKASIAGPAMEGLAYSADEPALKEMYLNLLARAVNKEKAAEVHPSFVEIIRQLSAEEVGALDICLRFSQPAARLLYRNLANGQFGVARSCVVHLVDSATQIPKVFDALPLWVDNWQRLRLLDLTFERRKADAEDGTEAYSWVKTRPEYMNAVSWLEAHGIAGTHEIAYDMGILEPTSFGVRFHQIVS